MGLHYHQEKKKLRRQCKPLPTLIKEKEPLWYQEYCSDIFGECVNVASV